MFLLKALVFLAEIFFIFIFVPVRCTTQVVTNSVNNARGKNAYYYYYDGPVHEIDKATGADLGSIPANTLLYGVKTGKHDLVCYKLVKGKPVLTYVVAGEAAGKRNKFGRFGYWHRFWRWWGYTSYDIDDISKDSNGSIRKDMAETRKLLEPWAAYYKVFSDKATADALAFFEREFKSITIMEHVSDDFDNIFREKNKGCYRLERHATYAPDKAKIYYISKSDRAKLDAIEKGMQKVYKTKFAEYCGEQISYTKALYSNFFLTVPVKVSKL